MKKRLDEWRRCRASHTWRTEKQMANNNYAPDKTHTHRQEKKTGKQEQAKTIRKHDKHSSRLQVKACCSFIRLAIGLWPWSNTLYFSTEKLQWICSASSLSSSFWAFSWFIPISYAFDEFRNHPAPHHPYQASVELLFMDFRTRIDPMRSTVIFVDGFFFGLATCDKYFSPFQEVIVVAQTEPVEKSCFPSFRRW